MSQPTFSVNPKYSWLVNHVISGETLVVGDEDAPLWGMKDWGINKIQYPSGDITKKKVIILGEQLEIADNPVELLKEAKKRADIVCITTPNEYSWNPQFKPFENPKHKRHYDLDTLCAHLEEAGLKYKIECLDFNGWSFFLVEAN